MVKTFLISPLVGAVTAVLGWIGAILLMSAMDDATFNSLRFGWAGLMVGSVSLVAVVLVIAMSETVEPMVTVLVAAAGTAMLWSRRELPITSANSYQSDTPAFYWATFTTMAVILLLLFMGLHTARLSNRRAKG